MNIGFIPLDNRPVSFDQVILLAKNAGLSLIHPPYDLLGNRQIKGNSDAICKWFLDNVKKVDKWLISLDMFCYGGLLASRQILEDLEIIKKRLSFFKKARVINPNLEIFAWQAIRRLSITVNTSDDIESWQKLSINHNERQRNHLINLANIDLVKQNLIDFLVFLQEDAKKDGIQLAEQNILNVKGKNLPILITNGTDEAPAILLNRFINHKKRIFPIFSSKKAEKMIALYEDQAISKSVLGQIKIANMQKTNNWLDADFILFVWTGNNSQIDLVFEKAIEYDAKTIKIMRAFIHKIKSFIKVKKVILADCAYANGSDNFFLKELTKSIDLKKLFGYAGWNTASNTIGHSLAQTITKDKFFLALRFLEDWGYQALARFKLNNYLNSKKLDIWQINETALPMAENYLKKELESFWQKRLSRFFPNLSIDKISLPWQRSFEVAVEFITKNQELS